MCVAVLVIVQQPVGAEQRHHTGDLFPFGK
jgi:hypothetical protein